MALGTPDARILYHAGLIAQARGEETAARDLLTQAREGVAMLPPLQVPRLDRATAELGERQP